MIKNYKLLIILFFLSINTNVYSLDQKIVYLNLDYIVQNSIPGKLIIKDLESEKKINIENFKLKENNLRNKEEEIIKKKNIISKEEFDSEVLALRKQMNVYNKEKKKIFSEYEQNKKKKLNEFLNKITPLIEDFVKENSINIVMNEKNLFIASKKFDITNQIIEIINKNY